MHDITLYHRASKGGIKVWRCFIADGTTIVTKWGLQGAKEQETRDPMKSRGKEGTKAYKTPDVVAVEEFNRRVKKKQDEGYVGDKGDIAGSVIAGGNTPVVSTSSLQLATLDFNNPPKSFAPAKPLNSIDPKELIAMEQAGRLMLQRKRDGMRHFIFFGSDRVQIFTRRMENASGQFTTVIEQLDSYRTQLAGTVLDAEFIVDKDGADSFVDVASICRSGDAKAQERLRYVKGWSFMVFDALYVKGHETFRKPYRDRHDLVKAIVLGMAGAGIAGLEPVEVLCMSMADALEQVKKNKWEGLVAWEADKATVVQLNGKPKRINCAKVKPLLEDDFVSTGYELGNGANSDVVGALLINQYIDGKLTAVGKVGTGFSQAQRKEALGWKFPCVVQVEFSERTPDGSLRFPVFVRKRDDKAPEECVFTPQTSLKDAD